MKLIIGIVIGIVLIILVIAGLGGGIIKSIADIFWKK